MSIKNAVIESTHLGKEDHGIATCFLNLKWEGSGQSFGGYTLTVPFIVRILDTLGVENWEALPGTMLRIDSEIHKIHSIGHIIKEQWFTPGNPEGKRTQPYTSKH